MNYEEIENVLEINGKESAIFMPNEIFEDLQGYLVDGSHIAFAYSFLYLTHFLYRNCKYFNVETLLDGNMIKQILGYSKSNRTMNYITKKDDGLLDEIGYTESTKDYPLAWQFEKGVDEDLSFIMHSEIGGKDVPRMFFLKKPLLALDNRIIKKTTYTDDGEKNVEEFEMLGTFFDIDNTHSVPFEVFMFCMGKKDLGVTAFYLYSWLRHRNDIFEGGYDVPMTKLSEETGISRRALIKYMDLLKGHKMVDFIHNQEFFVLGAFEEDRKATTYMTNDASYFLEEYTEYKKMGVQLREDYFEQKKAVHTVKDRVNVPISELPF